MIKSITTGDNDRPIRWGVAGHVTDDEAIAAVRAFDGDPALDLRVPGHVYERVQDVSPVDGDVWTESCEADAPGAYPITTVVPADSLAGRMWDYARPIPSTAYVYLTHIDDVDALLATGRISEPAAADLRAALAPGAVLCVAVEGGGE